jgi:catalase (peroxidase I)
MEPLSVTVAAIVTSAVGKAVGELVDKVGDKAADVARTIATTVLDRLRSDPAEERTVERYEEAPEAQQPALEAAIADLLEADAGFAARLQELVGQYETTKAQAMVALEGDLQDSQVIGQNDGIAVNRNAGTITQNVRSE